jgi:hypothetical protein
MLHARHCCVTVALLPHAVDTTAGSGAGAAESRMLLGAWWLGRFCPRACLAAGWGYKGAVDCERHMGVMEPAACRSDVTCCWHEKSRHVWYRIRRGVQRANGGYKILDE